MTDHTQTIDGTAEKVGMCQCGCGSAAPIAQRTDRKRGYVRGEPTRFVPGHNRGPTRKGPEWLSEDRGYTTPCHIWQHTLSGNGYGCVWNGERNVGAHRFFYERVRGAIPDGLQIDHLCRVRECVNVDHMQVVTGAENSRRRPFVRLTAESAAAIRASAEPNAVLAARFGVHPDYIKLVKAGRRWMK